MGTPMTIAAVFTLVMGIVVGFLEVGP